MWVVLIMGVQWQLKMNMLSTVPQNLKDQAQVWQKRWWTKSPHWGKHFHTLCCCSFKMMPLLNVVFSNLWYHFHILVRACSFCSLHKYLSGTNFLKHKQLIVRNVGPFPVKHLPFSRIISSEIQSILKCQVRKLVLSSRQAWLRESNMALPRAPWSGAWCSHREAKSTLVLTGAGMAWAEQLGHKKEQRTGQGFSALESEPWNPSGSFPWVLHLRGSSLLADGSGGNAFVPLRFRAGL